MTSTTTAGKDWLATHARTVDSTTVLNISGKPRTLPHADLSQSVQERQARLDRLRPRASAVLKASMFSPSTSPPIPRTAAWPPPLHRRPFSRPTAGADEPTDWPDQPSGPAGNAALLRIVPTHLTTWRDGGIASPWWIGNRLWPPDTFWPRSRRCLWVRLFSCCRKAHIPTE